MRYTYSRWTGSDSAGDFDADALMDAVSDDLISDGDIASAIKHVTAWGIKPGHSAGLPGIQHLLQSLREQRQHELERYDVNSILDDMERGVADVLEAERQGIARKLQGAKATCEDENLRATLQSIYRRKRDFLDAVAASPVAALRALVDYEFLEETARKRFEDLLSDVRHHVLQGHFKGIKESWEGLTDAELRQLTDMTHDLNQCLRDGSLDNQADFAKFMDRHGRYFRGARSFADITEEVQRRAAEMESLIRSMPLSMRGPLEEMMAVVLADGELQAELGALAETPQATREIPRSAPVYSFSGSEALTLQGALQLMRRLHDLDGLEVDLTTAQEGGNMGHVSVDDVGRLMGENAGNAAHRLRGLHAMLEEAGYADRGNGSLELTARGMRMIGQKALRDIFERLDRTAFGNHGVQRLGAGGDRSDQSNPYEFGDPFLLDMSRTLMNSISREGVGTPVRLKVVDFEVFRTQSCVQASTVLMIDMSRSMPLRGCFVAAKRVALALESLIRTQFPRDYLHVVGFSDFARELQTTAIYQRTWGDHGRGTNMQHGFVEARRLLARYRGGNKQIILITDGEPTAHVEGDVTHFAYPPTARTFEETLREVKRCTQEGIIINTFMLERSHCLTDFVSRMTHMNRGRAFFATPECLGDYIVVNYVNNKQGNGRR